MPSTPPPSASARATSPTCARAWPRWRAWCGRAGASSCSRSPTRQRPPLSWFHRVWFDRLVPMLGRVDRAGRRLQLPAQLGAPLPRSRGTCGYARIRGPREDPLGVDRGRHHRHPRRGARRSGDRADGRRWRARGGSPRRGAHGPDRGAPGGGHRRARRALGRARRLDHRGRGQAPAPAARAAVAAGPDATGDGVRARCRGRRARALGHAGPRRRARRAPSCAAAARPWWRRRAASIATATGDLLFSRAFAELADNGRIDEVQVLSDAELGAGRGRAAAARGRLGRLACRWSATCAAAS